MTATLPIPGPSEQVADHRASLHRDRTPSPVLPRLFQEGPALVQATEAPAECPIEDDVTLMPSRKKFCRAAQMGRAERFNHYGSAAGINRRSGQADSTLQ
jgi:hypothetical protein